MDMVPSPSTPLVFTFPETAQPVRTIMIHGEPWFVVADVCKILELSNPTVAADRLEGDDLSSAEVIDSMGRKQAARITSEPGLYGLIFQSRKAQARAFRRWLTHEVIPSIRRTGSYSTEPAPAGLPDVSSPAGVLALAEQFLATAKQLVAADERIAELEPVAQSWNILAAADGDFSVSDAAKILARDPHIQIGQKRLFTVLAELKWTYRQLADDRPRAMQHAIERRWLSELPMSHYHPRTGELVLDPPQVRVTVKGVHELHKRLGGTAPVQVPSVPSQGGAS